MASAPSFYIVFPGQLNTVSTFHIRAPHCPVFSSQPGIFHEPAESSKTTAHQSSENQRGGRIPILPPRVIFRPWPGCLPVRYTNPAKPMKAMARMPAVTSATGTPRMACGTSFSSSRSRIPAKTVSASAKPKAVETA